MATQGQASAAQKALTTSTSDKLFTHGVNGHSSVTAAAAAAAASAASFKTTSSATVQECSNISLSSNVGLKLSSCEDISVTLTEEQKRILCGEVGNFGECISQVPWMKFRVIAEPNMDVFASDVRLRAFIRQVTELSVSIVTKQCQEQIAALVAILVASLSTSMEARIKLVVETIMEQIASLCLGDSTTGCHNLHEIKEKVCFPKHCDPPTFYDVYGRKQPGDDYDDSDKHKHAHDTYGDSDKHKYPHDSHGEVKHGEGKPYPSEAPTKKDTGKSRPIPNKS